MAGVATSIERESTSPDGPPVRPVSQRQWQRDQTIAAIEQAALPVLFRLGYQATTAEHLAEAAGVSIRTLFRYFPTGKDDVILAELRRWIARIEASIRARPADEDLVTALRSGRAEWARRISTAPYSSAAALTAQIARDQPDLMVRTLGERQMLAERLVDEFARRLGLDPTDDVRPRLYAHCYVSALVTGYLESLTSTRPATELIDEAIELVLPLIGSGGGTAADS